MDTNTKLKAAVELKGIRTVTLRFGHAAQRGLVAVYSLLGRSGRTVSNTEEGFLQCIR